jgi:O-antigen/teichoic acid export membrane protein
LPRIISNTILARLLSTILNFFIVLMVSRSLGPAAKGEITFAITIISFIVFITAFVGGQGLAQLVDKAEPKRILLLSYAWCLVVGLGSWLVLEFVIPSTGFIAGHCALIACLNGMLFANQNFYLGKQDFSLYNFLGALPIVIQTAIIGTCFYALNMKFIDIVLKSLILSYSFSLVISLWFLKDDFTKETESTGPFELKSLLQQSFSFQITEFLQLLNLRFYFFLFGTIKDQAYLRLGIYSVGISILETVWIISRSMASINYSQTIRNPSPARTLKYLRFSVYGSALALLLIFMIPVRVYAEIFGDGFMYIKYAVKYLFPGIWAYTFVIIFSSYFTAMRRYLLVNAIYAFAFLVSITLCLLWIPKYEMSGAALAATISFLVSGFLFKLYFFAENKLNIKLLLPQKSDIHYLQQVWADVKEYMR